jgi:hypothetical protein
VFEIGKIALSEDSRALVEDSRIRKAYLGSSSSASCLPVSVPASVVSVQEDVLLWSNIHRFHRFTQISLGPGQETWNLPESL